MRLFCRMVPFLACALLLTALMTSGCAMQPSHETEQGVHRPSFPKNSPVPKAEVEKARRVLQRHLVAYSAGDIDAVLETVPRAQAQRYLANTGQMARHKGFRIKSITARPSSDYVVGMMWPDYVNLRVGYKAIVVFTVEGEYPNSTPDDNLLEEFDAIMARTPGGRWLYIAGMPKT